MVGNQDARPFVDLQKDAEEFRQKFDGDIKKCLAFLDGKITALICDPDSFSSPSRKGAIKQNALVEFSKAKYDIFISVKTLMNEMEREWMKYISEMKKLFIENVEIFLAGTKLEVKLPTSEFQTSPSFKESPRKEKSSITESLYPIINSFAKNMAALGSPLRNKGTNTGFKSTKILDDSSLRNDKDVSDDESESEHASGNEVQSDQLKRGSARVMLSKETSKMLGQIATPLTRKIEESDSTASDSESGLNRSRRTPLSRGRQSNDGKLNNSELNRSLSDSKSRNVIKTSSPVPKTKSPAVSKLSDSSDKERDSSLESSRSRGGRSRKEINSISSQEKDALPQVSRSRGGRYAKKLNSSSSQEHDVPTEVSDSKLDQSRKKTKSIPSQTESARKSRGRSIPKHMEKELTGRTSESSESEEEIVAEETSIRSSRQRGTTPAKPTKSVSQKTSTTAEESGTESSTRSSRRGSKTPAKSNLFVPQKSSTTTEESETESSTLSSRRGSKTSAKPNVLVAKKSSTTTEESETESSTGSRRKGKTPAKQTKSASQKSSTTTEESESESTKEAPRLVTKGRKGRTPASHNLINSTDNDVRTTRRGTAIETPVAPPSPKKSNLADSHIESGRSKSPKKVTFTPSNQTSDLDAFTPSLKSKSSIRRKTLLPNLDEIVSGADIIPGASHGRANKRKTIGGISDLAAAAPPKRLKVAERKSVSSKQVVDDADDNPLENDGNYSDWIPLKSADGKIPTKPGVYEVKVWRAKKPAYIGHCESLRQKITLHKLRHNSGHKHLDKFIERNMDDIQIRFEVMSSIDVAKSEAKDRVKNFISQHKTTPAYN